MTWATSFRGGRGWSCEWSAPSDLDALGRSQQGGFLLVWRTCLDRSVSMKFREHRAVGRTFGSFGIINVYGDAQIADLPWLLDILAIADEVVPLLARLWVIFSGSPPIPMLC